ncbi:hypothetical protein Tco_0541620, partial [Tanacetum coccineum]
MMENEARS